MSVENFAIIGGLILIIGGCFLFFVKEKHQEICYSFLRDDRWGLFLFSVASLWFLFKISQLGEADFGQYRSWLLLLFIFTFVGFGIYWRDFIGVRGLMMLVVMGVQKGLDIGYMSEALVRPYVSFYFYILIILALFFGAYPYWMRDILRKLFRKQCRYVKYIGIFHVFYGSVLVILSYL